MRSKSFKLTRPLGRTLIKAVFILGLILFGLEGLARGGILQNELQVGSLGIHNYLFEIKWFQLEEYVEDNGGVDVIFMGSSLVNSGIVPEEVSEAYAEITGEPELRVFNFGIEGMTIQPNSVVAEILIETYHPKAIIFGTEIRDYYAKNGVVVAERFLSEPWVQYQRGEFNLGGWLTENSAFYRYYSLNSNWMTYEFHENLTTVLKRVEILGEDGYDKENRVSKDHDLPPDPENNVEDREAIEFFADFEMDDGRLGNLQNMIDLGVEHGVTIIFVEMPVVPTFYGYFERGEEEHAHFLAVISEIITSNGNVLIPAPPESTFPKDGRSDRVHLNKHGAPVFSQYLGEVLAALSLNGEISLSIEGGAD